MKTNIKGLYTTRFGFSFIEIVIASAIGIVFFSGLVYLASTSRVQTTNTGNYLKALQIAQETMELVQSMPVSMLLNKKTQIFEGSLIDPSTQKSIKIPFHPSSTWKPVTKTYPDSYEKAYFYRKVRVESVKTSVPHARFMKKVAVDVYWNEGKKPSKIDTLGSDPDRMRKISIGTIVFNEGEIY